MTGKGDKVRFGMFTADRTTLYVRKGFRVSKFPLRGCRVGFQGGRSWTSGGRGRRHTSRSQFVQVVTGDGEVFTAEAGYLRSRGAQHFVTQVSEWVRRA